MYTVKAAAQKSGVSEHTIRMWERRYQAIIPERTESNRRTYTEEDVKRLSLLKRATDQGHAISMIAEMANEDILAMLSTEIRNSAVIHKPLKELTPPTIESAMQAIRDIDNITFENLMQDALTALGDSAFIEKFLSPLLYQIGEGWNDGALRISQEHEAAAAIRTFLGNMIRQSRPSDNAPILLSTTLPGQYHEFGAMIAAIIAGIQGWNAKYPGPNLPPEEIAFLLQRYQANALALSLMYPVSQKTLETYIRAIRQNSSTRSELIIGGTGALAHTDMLAELNVLYIKEWKEFKKILNTIANIVHF